MIDQEGVEPISIHGVANEIIASLKILKEREALIEKQKTVGSYFVINELNQRLMDLTNKEVFLMMHFLEKEEPFLARRPEWFRYRKYQDKFALVINNDQGTVKLLAVMRSQGDSFPIVLESKDVGLDFHINSKEQLLASLQLIFSRIWNTDEKLAKLAVGAHLDTQSS